MVNEAIRVSPTGRLMETQQEFRYLHQHRTNMIVPCDLSRSMVSIDFSAIERRIVQSIGLTESFPGL